MPRCCKQCGGNFGKGSYSRNQWSKGVGQSRCHTCVRGRGENTRPRARNTARTNNATHATYDPRPFAEGAFRLVAKGTYTKGERTGEACVVKWFKTGSVFAESFFANELKVVDKCIDMVAHWNAAGFVDKIVRVNRPQIWVRQNNQEKLMVEPFIQNYQKFNSNSGWATTDFPWERVMQAISHYSYHCSGGQFVLCDLQGGIYRDGIVLTDPAVHSRQGGYGPTDLGARGISSFFSSHTCNEFCRSNWQKPRDQNRYHNVCRGTTMLHVSSMSGCNVLPYMSRFDAVQEEERNPWSSDDDSDDDSDYF